VSALEAQLASKISQDAELRGAAATLQQREKECFELHRKLEARSSFLLFTQRFCIFLFVFLTLLQMQQQQLEELALENKTLLQVLVRCTNTKRPPCTLPLLISVLTSFAGSVTQICAERHMLSAKSAASSPLAAT
jgi:hypothetical protein